MNIESIHVGMQVRHPEYGVGRVEVVQKETVDVRFDSGFKTLEPKLSGLTPAEATAAVAGLDMPLAQLIEQVVGRTVDALGLEKPGKDIDGLGARWHGGKLVLHPADPTLQTKEIPLEVFFHKIVMMRNQFRVLEQKINANEKLTDGEKVEMQQYISRCYGTLTSFNVLFRDKADHFSGKSD